MVTWALKLAPAAARSLDRLPEKAAAAIVEFATGPLLDNPHRAGKPLKRELAAYHGARRGPYRIVYRIDDAGGAVEVLRIDHRAYAYRPDV